MVCMSVCTYLFTFNPNPLCHTCRSYWSVLRQQVLNQSKKLFLECHSLRFTRGLSQHPGKANRLHDRERCPGPTSHQRRMQSSFLRSTSAKFTVQVHMRYSIRYVLENSKEKPFKASFLWWSIWGMLPLRLQGIRGNFHHEILTIDFWKVPPLGRM